MLFQTPRSWVEKDECRYPEWWFNVAIVCSPFSQMTIAAWEESSPSIANEVSYEDDEGALDSD